MSEHPDHHDDSLEQALQRLRHEMKVVEAISGYSKLQVYKTKQRKKLPSFITNNLLLLTFLWQVLNVIIYSLAFEGSSVNNAGFDVGVGLMMLFQVIHLVFIVVTSIKLTKQVLHRTATGWFLTQSYLSTILLFAGIYTLFQRLIPSCFSGLYLQGEGGAAHAVVFVRFLYYSVTIMSTVGFGDVRSASWYTDCIVIAQMLLSVLYTTVIFAKGLSHFQGTELVTKPPHVESSVRSSRSLNEAI